MKLTKKDLKRSSDIIRYVGIISQLGFIAVFSILFFVLLAIYISNRMGAREVLLPLGILLGISTAFTASYRILKRFLKK